MYGLFMRQKLPSKADFEGALSRYRKIPKNKPWLIKACFAGLIFGGAYFLRGLLLERILRFKMDSARQ